MANITPIGAPVNVTGGVNSAVLETVLPVDSTAALDPAFTALGYIGEDGLSQTTDRGTEIVRAWGGDEVIRIQTEFGVSFTFTFLVTNKNVLTEVYGPDNVTAAGTAGSETLAIKINKNPLPRKSWVFEVKDGENRIRIVLPVAQITNVADITYVHSDVIRYEVTVTAYPDANGNQGYKYVSGPAAA